MRAAPILVAILLAGCAEAPPPNGSLGTGPAASLHGTFSQERTQATLDAWCEVAREHANQCALMESFPEQYRLGFADLAECETARAKLLAIEHVHPGQCTPENDGAAGSPAG